MKGRSWIKRGDIGREETDEGRRRMKGGNGSTGKWNQLTEELD
jgi:hypothetical protein